MLWNGDAVTTIDMDDDQVSRVRTLLIELLAHQFAFPVQWIQTQEHILANAQIGQRLVEIGPSQVLTSMTKKTAAGTFGVHDKTHHVQREFLPYEDHAEKLYHRYAPRTESQFICPSLLGSDVIASEAMEASLTVDSRNLAAVQDDKLECFGTRSNGPQRHPEPKKGPSQMEIAQRFISVPDLTQQKLMEWEAEFDTDFFNGIKAVFDANKIRLYDSWWNWIREDIMVLLHGVSTGQLLPDSDHLRCLMSNISNRMDPSCEELLRVGGQQLTDDKLKAILTQTSSILGTDSPHVRHDGQSLMPHTVVLENGDIEYKEVPRTFPNGLEKGTYGQIIQQGGFSKAMNSRIDYIHLKSRLDDCWSNDQDLTTKYLSVLDRGMSEGLSFVGKTALITGAGPNSIGADIVRGLLTGGATVILTTSREVSASAKFYQTMYRDVAGPGASLRLVPLNPASRQDCKNLIDYIFSEQSGISDLDLVLPFAAIPQAGQLDSLEGRSELAQRAMLTNVLRLLGHIRKAKVGRKSFARPTNVILPLSPNHGTLGGDGLYGETKLGLETLFNRGRSEDWDDLLTITGVVIGWTRGTGLMSANDIVAPAIEQHGVMTFSQSEIAFNILALMSSEMVSLYDENPIRADIDGGLHIVQDLKQVISAAHDEIINESRLKKALSAENAREQIMLAGPPSIKQTILAQSRPRARLILDHPRLPPYKDITAGLANAQGMHDLEQVIVVVGYSELGPWGSARTRWEIEHADKLSVPGLIELAWMTGMVKHKYGGIHGEEYAGWVDAETDEPVHDADFQQRYEERILQRSGLRFIDTNERDSYSAQKKETLQEVTLDDDLPGFEASKGSADALVQRHGKLASIESVAGTEHYRVHLKKGATLHVPKAVGTGQFVAGQLPEGFDAARYGLPPEIVSQVEPVVLYVLCCISEAVLMAGLRDPLELYQYIHVSELANCLGTGAGDVLAMKSLKEDRLVDLPAQNDVLQESHLNTIRAWSSTLLMASSGPVRTPTGVYATAIESLDAGVELIKAGKARAAIVGGSDDLQKRVFNQSSEMAVNANTHEELRKGRTPGEMSRSISTSHAGSVESAGCGVQLIMTAELALKMGLCIYGIVGHTQVAGDQPDCSFSATGPGVLTAAKESSEAGHSVLLDFAYRREMLQHALSTIEATQQVQLNGLKQRRASARQLAQVEDAALSAAKDARCRWGTNIRKQDPNISPIRAALTAWNLTVDDIAVASFHSSSTEANDTIEVDVINSQMTHLGRTDGNPLSVICQTHVTGHPRGAAGAWMMNGGVQVLQSGKIPGNRNADNIDKEFQQFKHLVFPSKTVQTNGVKAFMLTSFGAEQKGGLVVMIHPRYLFSAIRSETYEQYRAQAEKRSMTASALFARGLTTNSLCKPKTRSPWKDIGEKSVFLDPLARMSGTNPFKLTFDGNNMHPETATIDIEASLSHTQAAQSEVVTALPQSLDTLPEAITESKDSQAVFESWLEQAFSKGINAVGVGVDIQDLGNVPMNEIFISRNYTPQEREYCEHDPNTRASYAGRWAAKEAVFKSLKTRSDRADTSMHAIEILLDKDDIPRVMLHDKVRDIALEKGISRIDVSISHSEDQVMAVAAALKKDV